MGQPASLTLSVFRSPVPEQQIFIAAIRLVDENDLMSAARSRAALWPPSGSSDLSGYKYPMVIL